MENGDIQLAESGGEFHTRVTVGSVVTPDGQPLPEGEYLAKVRSTAAPAPCRVTSDGGALTACFARPVRAAAPGQSAVFYKDGYVAGGGIILAAE